LGNLVTLAKREVHFPNTPGNTFPVYPIAHAQANNELCCMKARIKRDSLLSALKAVAPICKKGSLALTEQVSFNAAPGESDKLILATTDLEHEAICTIPITYSEPWSGDGDGVAVNCKLLVDALTKLPKGSDSEYVDIYAVEETSLEITCGSMTFTLPGTLAHAGAGMLSDVKNHFVEVFSSPFEWWQDHIKPCVAFCGNDELRLAMQGVFLDFDAGKNEGNPITVAATNAHFLTWHEFNESGLSEISLWDKDGSNHILLHSKLLNVVMNSFAGLKNDSANPIRLMQSPRSIMFVHNMGGTSFSVSGRKLDAVFPAWRAVLPEPRTIRYEVKINRKDLIASVEHANIFVQDNTHLMVLDLSAHAKNSLAVSSENDSKGRSQSVLTCQYLCVPNDVDNEDFKIGVNSRLFLQLLRSYDCEWLCMSFIQANYAISIHNPEETTGRKSILMPVLLGY
jgi:DNA polymerase III sliding clamp (beta) subunit (PCNA family)